VENEMMKRGERVECQKLYMQMGTKIEKRRKRRVADTIR
jgi:hypothetical protein